MKVIKCDSCETDLSKGEIVGVATLPRPSMYTLSYRPGYSNYSHTVTSKYQMEDKHFCSEKCIKEWSGRI